jgi:hypothetical protein
MDVSDACIFRHHPEFPQRNAGLGRSSKGVSAFGILTPANRLVFQWRYRHDCEWSKRELRYLIPTGLLDVLLCGYPIKIVQRSWFQLGIGPSPSALPLPNC